MWETIDSDCNHGNVGSMRSASSTLHPKPKMLCLPPSGLRVMNPAAAHRRSVMKPLISRVLLGGDAFTDVQDLMDESSIRFHIAEERPRSCRMDWEMRCVPCGGLGVNA